MAVLPVLKFPHPVLKQQAQAVTRFDAELEKLARSMLETMYQEGGIGLAANQVGQLRRLLVMDLKNNDHPEGKPPPPGKREREPRYFVNPRILESRGEITTDEGCLSVVDFTAEVKRAQHIKVTYQTLQGETRTEDLEDLAAICLQHEVDHLNGKLFIDHLPLLRRQMVKKRLAKLQRTA